jgi:DNA-binding Lrp family transcriptional regulator
MGEGSGKLDRMDIRILQTLSEHGRISWRDMADRIGLSLTPTLRRVKRLESEGYITGYAVVLDEAKIAGSMSVFVSVTLERQADATMSAFEVAVAKLPNVASCYMMTGNSDYLLRVVVRDLAQYQEVLRELTRIADIAHIQSSFALRAVIQRPSVPI